MEFDFKNPKIFILSGKARSGKNIASNKICEFYKDKKCIKISFGYYLKDYAKRIIGYDEEKDEKPRDFLQNLGIELIKNKIDNKLLINRVCSDIEVFSYFYDVIIVTDARLIDEIEDLRSKFKLIVIRIQRNEFDNKLNEHQKSHLSEIDLDNYKNYDYVVDNDGTDNFNKEINNILERVEEYEK